MTPIVELEDIWKACDEVQAHGDLNLVYRGERFGTLGPNGVRKRIVKLLRLSRYHQAFFQVSAP